MKQLISPNFVATQVPFVLSNLIRTATPILVLPFCISLIGAERFGVLSGEYATAIFMGFVVDFSIATFGTAELVKTERGARLARTVNLLVLRFLLFFVCLLLLATVATMISGVATTTFTLFFVLFGASVVFDVTWLYLASKRFWLFLTSHLLGFSLAFIFVFSWGATGEISDELKIILLLTCPILFTNVISFIALGVTGKVTTRFFGPVLSIQSLWRELSMGAPVFFSQIVSALYSNSGPILLNFYGRPELAGIWLVMNRLVTGVGNFATLPAKASIKNTCDAWAAQAKLFGRHIYKELLVFFGATSLAALPLLFWPNLFSDYFLAGEYTLTRLDAVLLVVWMILPFFAYLVTTFLIFRQKRRTLLLLTSSNLIVNLLLSYPLVLWLGFAGYLLSMIISQAFLAYVFVRESVPISTSSQLTP